MSSPLSSVADRVRALQRQWSGGRRAFVPGGLLVLIAAVAVSGLVAAADSPGSARAAAKTSHARPKYLLPTGELVKQHWLPAPTLTGDDGTVGVPAGTPRPPATPKPGQLAQQAPLIAAFRGADGTITPAGIATLALTAGCSSGPAVVATAIAMAESGGSPSAQGDIALMDSVWDWSAGLWQIRGLRAERNTGGLRDSVANQAVDKNAAAMQVISQGCTDWTPWSTFNTGAYLQFMSLAHQAVAYVVRWFNAHGHHYPPVPAPDPNASIPSAGSGSDGGAAAAAAPAARSSSRPKPRTSSRAAAAGPGAKSSRANPAPGAPNQPAPTSSAAGGGGGVPLPAPTTSNPLPLPLPTSSVPKLPLPSVTLPKLPLPTTTLPPILP